MEAVHAKSMADWLDRQKSYRFGTILILPPAAVCQAIDPLRARYDPMSQAAIGAHISLTVPLPRALTDRHWGQLLQVASRFPALEIRYGPVIPFLPNPGAALHIEPQPDLDGLRLALEACDLFQGAAPRIHPFWAHMTIAEFIDADRSRTMIGEIGADSSLTGSFTCEHLSYVVPNEGFRFHEHGNLALSGLYK
jgi:hypothetical protein